MWRMASFPVYSVFITMVFAKRKFVVKCPDGHQLQTKITAKLPAEDYKIRCESSGMVKQPIKPHISQHLVIGPFWATAPLIVLSPHTLT